MTKVIEVADGDEDFLERFDALVRSVRNAAVDPDVPVGLRYESGEEGSVLTITVQNLAGQIAKEEREAKADRDKAAHAAMVATREARAKEKRAARLSGASGEAPPADESQEKPATAVAESVAGSVAGVNIEEPPDPIWPPVGQQDDPLGDGASGKPGKPGKKKPQ